MKILWHSNAPYAATGYGVQTNLFTSRLSKMGHNVYVSCFYGLHGAILKGEYDVTILPAASDPFGNDILVAHYNEIEPDVVISLMDIWVLTRDTLNNIPLTAWTPIDHMPVPPAVAERLSNVTWTWAMSRFGEQQIKNAGFLATYMPHGFDPDVYYYMEQSRARELIKIEQDKFLVVVNAANKGNPSRKSLDKILQAWALFVKEHPNSLLYMHTIPTPMTAGVDLIQMASLLGIDPETIRFPVIYKYLQGGYSPEALRNIYAAADVLLAPSMGEGFGLSVIEAEACGTPAIISDFSAQPELVHTGYTLPYDPVDDLIITNQGAFQVYPRVSKIVEALEFYADGSEEEPSRTERAEWAFENYNADFILEEYMLPSLNEMAKWNKDWSVQDE